MSNTDNIYNGIFYCAQGDVSEQVFECTAISGAEFSACYRYDSCWMKTKFVESVGDIPSETQYLLAKRSVGYTLYFMLCDGNARASLFGEDGKVFCRVETGDENIPLGEYRYMYALDCVDPYDGIELAYKELNAALRSFKLKKDKKQPSFIDR